MTGMKRFGSALSAALGSVSGGAAAAKAARAARVKEMWAGVIEATCGAAARMLLDHTNSVYIIRGPARGLSRAARRDAAAADAPDEKTLIVYVDDSLVAAELDARREMIKLRLLERFNERIDAFHIAVSRGSYRHMHPFRRQESGEGDTLSAVRPVPLSDRRLEEIERAVSVVPDERVRKALKRAMISDLQWKLGESAQKGENRPLEGL